MPEGERRALTGWGRATWSTADVVTAADAADVAAIVGRARPSDRGVLARGLGRSYGDAATNGGGTVIDLTGQQQPLDLDDATGLLRVGAGVSLDRVMAVIVPRGWFVPVTPGTRFVTVGGAIAADIHGKNHHGAGSFCEHVVSLTMAMADGSLRVVTPGEDPRLFWATAGGMGLTGVIVEATIRLVSISSSRLLATTARHPDLAATMAALMVAEAAEPYAVAWLDLLARGRHLGRGVVSAGHFAAPTELGRVDGERLAYHPGSLPGVPALVPGGLLNRTTVAAFNQLWFRRVSRQPRPRPTSIGAFFHPLDGVPGWNHLYGPRGFLQWQMVVPSAATAALEDIVGRLVVARVPSFLTVLKRFRPGNSGLLSFPMEGWTLTVDVATTTPDLGPLLDTLDDLVVEAGGRIYLAKDSRLRPELLPAMYPRLDDFRALRAELDPHRRFTSDLARRLGI